jgi:hypothetical protein
MPAFKYYTGTQFETVADARASMQRPIVGSAYPLPFGPALFANTSDANMIVNAVPMPFPVSIDQVGVHVQTAGVGSETDIGIWAPSSSGGGGALIYSTTVDSSTTGEKIVTVSPLLRLDYGMIYVGHRTRVANAALRSKSGDRASFPVWPSTATEAFANNANTTFFRNISSNPLPNPLEEYGALAPSGRGPLVLFMRVAEVH